MSILIISTFASSCDNSYKPVCGSNGVTYTNTCKCQEARVDVNYPGACRTNVSVEWVKRPDENKNIKYYPNRREEKPQPLNLGREIAWGDYSWTYPGWGDYYNDNSFGDNYWNRGWNSNGIYGYNGLNAWNNWGLFNPHERRIDVDA